MNEGEAARILERLVAVSDDPANDSTTALGDAVVNIVEDARAWLASLSVPCGVRKRNGRRCRRQQTTTIQNSQTGAHRRVCDHHLDNAGELDRWGNEAEDPAGGFWSPILTGTRIHFKHGLTGRWLRTTITGVLPTGYWVTASGHLVRPGDCIVKQLEEES